MRTLRANGRGIGIWIEAGNGQHLEMAQAEDGGMIDVRRVEGDTVESTVRISPGDMAAMIDWFRRQKEEGNIGLGF
ncbi:MAG: hypothetical protein LBS32_07600 [Clostridiales Family XIII bacterium]|jgi:hypothetical protein|nr:hypothetical protein [Clostridiales Family XIII bacterium]